MIRKLSNIALRPNWIGARKFHFSKNQAAKVLLTDGVDEVIIGIRSLNMTYSCNFKYYRNVSNYLKKEDMKLIYLKHFRKVN